MTARREELAVLALVLLPLLLFLDKGVSIDAPVFVAVARQVVEAPADPFGFDMVWDSTSPHAWEFNRNPPLTSYWLAPWIALFGAREVVMHAAALPFAALAALAFLGIARRLTGEGLLPTALLVTTPAFLVLATTLMLDVPVLAFMLLAVYALLRGVEPDAERWLWIAGAAVAAAGLAKYVGFCAAPLLAAGAWLLAPRRGPALLRVLLPPLLVWGAWGALSAGLYGSVHFLGSTDVVWDKSFEPDEFWNRIVSTPIWYGGALLFPIALWAVVLVRGRRGTELAVLGVVLGTAAAYWVIPDGEPSRRNPIELEESVFAALSFAGAFFVWAWLLRPSRFRAGATERFLLLWLGGLLVFSALLNWHVNAADALLAAPPVLLLLYRCDDLRPGRRLAAGCAALMLAVSLLLAWADAVQTGFYREAAARIESEIGERPGAGWFVGQWGLHHYLDGIGFEAVVPPMYGKPELAVDDWIVSARNVAQIDVSRDLARYPMHEVWRWEKTHWLPLRTTNPDAGAGFYSSNYGYVPFAWSRRPFDVVQLGRIRGAR